MPEKEKCCLQEVTVSVPTVADTDNITLTSTTTFITAKNEIILVVGNINDLLQDETAIISVTDGVAVIPLETKYGYNVRADSLVQRAANMKGGLNGNSTIKLRVVIATDPARAVCKTPLRKSSNVRPATTVGTATGTGINLD